MPSGPCEHVGELCPWADTSCVGSYQGMADHTWQFGPSECSPPPGTVCSPAMPCPSGTFCDYPDDLCGAGQPGMCVNVPVGCGKNLQITCGCNGTNYDNACMAQSQGVDVSNTGGCAAPAGTFACGSIYCAAGVDYCLRTTSDTGGADSYSCAPLPAGCGASPSCACLAAEPCGTLCEAGADGKITVTCPGG
jgi:hypothetical protein